MPKIKRRLNKGRKSVQNNSSTYWSWKLTKLQEDFLLVCVRGLAFKTKLCRIELLLVVASYYRASKIIRRVFLVRGFWLEVFTI